MRRNKCEQLCVWGSGHMEHLTKHMLCLKKEEVAIFFEKKIQCKRGKKEQDCLWTAIQEHRKETRTFGHQHGFPPFFL